MKSRSAAPCDSTPCHLHVHSFENCHSAPSAFAPFGQPRAPKRRSCDVDRCRSQRHTFRWRPSTSRNPLNQHRKTYEPTPYAALRGEESVAVSPALPAVSASAAIPASSGNQEAKRLSELRQALWGAFEAGGPLPMPLIEFTHAYTAALRLELNLLGYAKPLASDAGRRGMPSVLRGKS